MSGNLLRAIGGGAGRLRLVGTHFLGRAEERAGITPSGALMIGMAVVGWILARVLGSRAVFLLVYGCILVVAVAWLLGRRGLEIDATRSSLSPRVRAGQLVEVELQLSPRRRASNVIVEEMMPPQLGQRVRVPITELPPRKSVAHTYRFAPRYRGVYDVGPLVLTRSDPFGFTKRRTVLTGPTEIVVHPSTEPLQDRVSTREWEDPPIRPPVSKPWPTGFDFYGMRDYAVGDDPRRIVWRASARMVDPLTGDPKYVVRESEQGITDRVSLILDTDVRAHSPGDPSETFETAVRAVASLGERHLRDGFSVTLEINSRRVLDAIRGERTRINLLDELARVEREKHSLASLIERLSTDRRRRNVHTVVVTTDVDAEAAARLRRLVGRESLLIALVLWADSDPASISRAASLGCNVVELESGVGLQNAFRRVVGAGVRREH